MGQCVPLLGGGAVWVAWKTIFPTGFAFQKMKTVSVPGMLEMKVTATKKCSDMCEMNLKCNGMCVKCSNMCEIRVRILKKGILPRSRIRIISKNWIQH